jgi:hypothetical protein
MKGMRGRGPSPSEEVVWVIADAIERVRNRAGEAAALTLARQALAAIVPPDDEPAAETAPDAPTAERRDVRPR